MHLLKFSMVTCIKNNLLFFFFFFQARLYRDPCCIRGRTYHSFPHLLAPQGGDGQAGSSYGVKGGDVSRDSLGGAVFRERVQYPGLALGSAAVAVGFFGISVSFVQNLYNCAGMLFSVPYSFFEFCCLRRAVSKHCSTAVEDPGPSLSHAP